MKVITSVFSNDSEHFLNARCIFLSVLDMLISMLIVSPAVVGYWRSVWELMDIHVLPENPLISATVSFVIGVCGQVLFSLSGKTFTETFHLNRNRFVFYVVSRSYTVCYSFIGINSWRGLWYLFDMNSNRFIFMSTVTAVITLIVIRGLKNISSSPCVIVTDGVDGYFNVTTMFRISVS